MDECDQNENEDILVNSNIIVPQTPSTNNKKFEGLETTTPATIKQIRKHLLFSPTSPFPQSTIATLASTLPQKKVEKQTVQVFLRIRPFTSEEILRREKQCIEVLSDTQIVIRPSKDATRANTETESKYTFSQVFNTTTTQSQIFKATTLPLIESFLSGQNCLIFAYGITNAGKTYTISGTPKDQGITPRILDMVFKSIAEKSEPHEVQEENVIHVNPGMKVAAFLSYVEIYNEHIYDLLAEPPSLISSNQETLKREPLKLKEDAQGKVYIKGVKESIITSAQDGYDLIALAQKNRMMASTNLNRDSSRSHSVLTIKMVQMPKTATKADLSANPNICRLSKLSVVDLAGSERTARTQASGIRLKEAANINNSLSVFGRCLEALKHNQIHGTTGNKVVVPFRESKMTRIFQDFFVGNGKAVMLVNVNPASRDYDETMNVLRFSALAKEIITSSRLNTGRGIKQPVTSSMMNVAANLAQEMVTPDEEDEEMTDATKTENENPKNSEITSENATPNNSQENSNTPAPSVIREISLLAELQATKIKLMQIENQLNETQSKLEEAQKQLGLQEYKIRDEVGDELTQILADNDRMYKDKLELEIQLVEEKYEKKQEILTRSHAQILQTITEIQATQQLKKEEEAEEEKIDWRDECERMETIRSELEEKYDLIMNELEQAKEIESEMNVTIQRLLSSKEQLENEKLEDESKINFLMEKARTAVIEKEEHTAFLNARFSREMEERNLQIQTKHTTEIQNLEFIIEKERKDKEAMFIEMEAMRARIASLISLTTFNITKEADESAPLTISHGATPLSKKTHIVTSPKSLKKDLKKSKYKKYEVIDQSETGEKSSWKGDINKSVSGDGVSVRFTEVSVLSTPSENNPPIKSRSAIPISSHPLQSPFPQRQEDRFQAEGLIMQETESPKENNNHNANKNDHEENVNDENEGSTQWEEVLIDSPENENNNKGTKRKIIKEKKGKEKKRKSEEIHSTSEKSQIKDNFFSIGRKFLSSVTSSPSIKSKQFSSPLTTPNKENIVIPKMTNQGYNNEDVPKMTDSMHSPVSMPPSLSAVFVRPTPSSNKVKSPLSPQNSKRRSIEVPKTPFNGKENSVENSEENAPKKGTRRLFKASNKPTFIENSTPPPSNSTPTSSVIKPENIIQISPTNQTKRGRKKADKTAKETVKETGTPISKRTRAKTRNPIYAF